MKGDLFAGASPEVGGLAARMLQQRLLLRSSLIPYQLHQACTALRQLHSFRNAVTLGAQRNDALMQLRVRSPSAVLARRFGDRDTLLLPLSAIFVIVASGLQGNLEQHVLNRLQHDFRDAFGLAGELGQINHTRNSQLRTLATDGADKQLGVGEGEATDRGLAVNSTRWAIIYLTI